MIQGISRWARVLQVPAAAKAANVRRPMDEIVDLLQDLAARTFCFAAQDTVEFLQRSGHRLYSQRDIDTIKRISGE